MTSYPPFRLVCAWIALLALLTTTVLVSYVPLGAANAVIALGIAALKAAIVGVVFMELWQRRSPLLIFAGAGLFWLGILLWLGMMDFLTRT